MTDRYPKVLYPYSEVDEPYKPQIGDKVEITYDNGTILIATIDRVSTDSGAAWDSLDRLLWAWYKYDRRISSIRLLSRTKAIEVGDEIPNDRLIELPPGSVFERIYPSGYSYDVVVVNRGRGLRYMSPTEERAWPSFKNGHTRNIVKFINRR